MQAVFYSQDRNDFEEFIITTKDNKQAVLISYDKYSSMKETLYLLSSKTNRNQLLKAIEEIDNLKYAKKDINI
jgi:antitoxin YefM